MKYIVVMEKIRRGMLSFGMKNFADPKIITMSPQTKEDLHNAIVGQRNALVNAFGLPETKTLNSFDIASIYGMKIETNDHIPAGVFVIGGEIITDSDEVAITAE